MLQSQSIAVNQEKPMFRLFVLKNNTTLDVEITEVDKINFSDVLAHLDKGDSIFISPKREHQVEPILPTANKTADPWYFVHI